MPRPRSPLWALAAAAAFGSWAGCNSEYWSLRGRDALEVFDAAISLGPGARATVYTTFPILDDWDDAPERTTEPPSEPGSSEEGAE